MESMEFIIKSSITIAVVLSILLGYSLFKGGKEIENNNIKMAGIYSLLIIGVFLIVLLFMADEKLRMVKELQKIERGT